MPRYLVTERVYVDADNEMHATNKSYRPLRAGQDIRLLDRTAERVAPELEVGMPVRLVRRKHRPSAYVPLGSQGVVVAEEATGSVSVVFHAPHERRPDGPPWTRQCVNPADLEVVEGWSS